ncbi:MAG: tetratricopeptide repeat protein [Clostridia bacterium]|nr:tetratricopeptide repeat protein [Clostridia bacterium]
MSEINKMDNVEFDKTETDDYMDFYWDTLDLADDLFEKGRYNEAEELYKKIANEKDEAGDASAHYGYLLDKLGRYEEAYFCFRRALNGDTSPAEGVSVFVDECLCNEDSPYWHYFYNQAVFSRYFEMCDSIGKNPDVERILLNCLKSKDELCVSTAIAKLIQLYGTGNYVFSNCEAVDVAVPDLDKLKTFVAEVVKDKYDLWDMIDSLCPDTENMDESTAQALEEALLAVEFDAAQEFANDSFFWLYLSGEAYYNDYEDLIYYPSFKNLHKAAKIMLNMDVEQLVNDLFDYYDWEIIVELLEEAHRICPNDWNVALQLLLYVEPDRFAELIREISDVCARALIATHGDKALFGKYLCPDEIEDEEIEKYYIALLDFFCKYDPEGDYCDATKKLLLSAYQFGTFKWFKDTNYVLNLQNAEKAEALAKKYGMELLSEQFDSSIYD